MTWLAARALLRRIPWQVWAGAALIAAYWWIDSRAYQRGEAAAVSQIEEANREADRKADAGEDDVARCYRSGGRWVRKDGSCQQALRRD